MAGIYIHIPFCKTKCIYCDFYSIITLKFVDDYVDAVRKEVSIRKAELNDCEIKTIYIGGGTPSLLTISQIKSVVDCLKSEFDLSSLEEFTIEANPEDISFSYVKDLIDLGVNRISIGIQSFDDGDLKLINRRHNSSKAIEAVNIIKQAGITNISIDLIYGLPGQTIGKWIENLKTAVSLDVKHISAYNLSYEEGTKLSNMRKNGLIKECTDEECVAMYKSTLSALSAAGFEQYEISNYAKPGYHSIHNSNYWNETPYLGLGASAHSLTENVRKHNIIDIRQYIAILKDGEVPYEIDLENWRDKYDDLIMISLRTAVGINVKSIKQRFGDAVYNSFCNKAKKYIAQGYIRINGDNYTLTDDGVMVSDMIIRDLMYDE
jgi:oxygen-independent coproporphyrinogen-3 oxidase